jgi:1,4-dihydroxy-2-naphthoyl-CoA hydrolase
MRDPQQEAGALMAKMELEITEASPDAVVGSLPVEGNNQPYGLFHGGASGALAESLALIGAKLGASHPDERRARVVEIKVNHIRPGTHGRITGEARSLFKDETIQVWEIRMRDDEGRLTAFSTATLSLEG